MIDDVIERCDDIADGTAPCTIQHLQHDDSRIRCDAAARAVRIKAVPRDDAGDVRTVAVVVVWGGLTVDEIDEPVYALSSRGGGEIVVPRRHARVDHGHTDARSV